jgi:ABC-type multidrug transport system fused ATPase/permease subunit
VYRSPKFNLNEYLSILDPPSKKKFFRVVFAQSLLGFLDLLGVLMIGIVASLAIQGVQSKSPGGRTEQVLSFINLDKLDFQLQVIVLSLLATTFLIVKSITTIILNRKILYFLSHRAADLSEKLLSKFLSQPILGVQTTSSQDIQYAAGSGVAAIALGIIGTTATIISDSFLLILLLGGLFAVDPFIALTSLLLFSFVGLVMYQLTHKKARYLGSEMARLNVQSQINIQELVTSYREIYIRNRREFYLWRISKLRHQYANVLAEQTFMPNVSKYVLEVSIILGALAMCGMQFVLHDASHAIASMAIFIVAGSRIAPALLRLQQNFVQIRANQGIAKSTLQLLNKVDLFPEIFPRNIKFNENHERFSPHISIKGVSFKYPAADSFIFENLSLEIPSGSFVAFAGKSGSGKSTLVDLILGVHIPQKGEILISHKQIDSVVSGWPGIIGYVPQNIGVIAGSVRENLSLGFDPNDFTDHDYWRVLEISHLHEFVQSLPGGLDFDIGEFGSKFSGGQRQRLGIARALLTRPKILVLDEATSALDSETELAISESIFELKGNVTTIVIAHRLSTIVSADRVIYLDEGRIKAMGTFDELRQRVPNFETQAGLQGL